MRPLVALTVLMLLLAGCGGKVVLPVANTVVGTVPGQPSAEPVPAQYAHGDPTAGAPLFKSKGCNACHTLKAAGATGTVGPDLDISKPTLGRVLDRLLHGGKLGAAAMPAFKSVLTTKQIADLAAYVVQATQKG